MFKGKTVGKAHAVRPNGYLTYHHVQGSQILRSVHTMHVPVMYGSENSEYFPVHIQGCW